MASDDGLQQLATLLTKLDQRASDVGEAIRLLQDVIPDLERRLDDLAVRLQPFLEASKPLDDVQTKLQKAADAIQARADALDAWMNSATERLEESLQERDRLLEQRAESLLQAMNQRVEGLVSSVQEACTGMQKQTLADVELRLQQLEEWMDSTSQLLREELDKRQSDLEERAELVFKSANKRVGDFGASVEAACASLKDQASKFDELEKWATEDVRKVVEAASRRDDEIALRLAIWHRTWSVRSKRFAAAARRAFETWKLLRSRSGSRPMPSPPAWP